MINVLLIDDMKLLRVLIRDTLEQYPDVRVIGETGNGIEGYNLALSLRPHVVITDISIPGLDGVTLTGRLKAAVPTMIIIGMSVFNDAKSQQEMLAAGASGFVTKENVVTDLISLILKLCVK